MAVETVDDERTRPQIAELAIVTSPAMTNNGTARRGAFLSVFLAASVSPAFFTDSSPGFPDHFCLKSLFFSRLLLVFSDKSVARRWAQGRGRRPSGAVIRKETSARVKRLGGP